MDSRGGGGPEYDNKLKLVPVRQFHQKIESSIFEGATSAEAIGNVQIQTNPFQLLAIYGNETIIDYCKYSCGIAS